MCALRLFGTSTFVSGLEVIIDLKIEIERDQSPTSNSCVKFDQTTMTFILSIPAHRFLFTNDHDEAMDDTANNTDEKTSSRETRKVDE